MSGLKINFEKSELFLVGGHNNIAQEYADVFNCQVGLFPINYIDVPVSPSRLKVADWLKLEEKHAKKLDVWQGNSISIGGTSRLKVADWLKLEEKHAKKLDVWQGNSISIGGKIVLINSSLSNTATYHMSMFLMPLTTIKRMDKVRRKFFWQEGQLKKK
jgi:hypothetical protein